MSKNSFEEISGSIVAFCIMFSILLFPFWVSDSDEWFSDEITVYGISCKKNPEASLDECGKWVDRKYFTLKFKVFADAQYVIKMVSGGVVKVGLDGGCVVWDKNDWTCGSNFGSSIMSDGNYKIILSKGDSWSDFFPKWKWILKGGWLYYPRKWFDWDLQAITQPTKNKDKN